jgi:hypothetical protein
MTPVTVMVAAGSIAAGLLTAVPAAAGPPSDPVSGLVGELAGHHRERQGQRDYGRTHADNGRLKHGCRPYRYHYELDIRTNDWTLETFLDDRRGETIASGALASGADPKKGSAVFRFCRYNTVAGRFTIRAKLIFYTDSGDHKAWLEPSRFRLRPPR